MTKDLRDSAQRVQDFIRAKGFSFEVKDKVGFAIGGIPPVGHKVPLKTILDPDLQRYDIIWAAAGTPFAVFQLKPEDLGPLTKGQWLDLRMDT